MKTGSSSALLITLLSLVLAAPASGAMTPNSCRYSFDGLFRDMPVTIDATASIEPDGRYPAPTEVVPGQTLRTAPGTAGVALPAYIVPFGYAVGLLHAGRNDIPVKVWITIAATNTKERAQVVGPVDVTATTTITVDPADDNRFVSATPWVYTTPVVPALTWTAVGGDVVFSQDAGGNLPQLPVGTGGALRAVTGSVVIHASFPASGAAIYMDCRPGRTTGIEFDFAGPGYEPGPPVAFDRKAGPRNTTCLSSVGRTVSGAPANFPDGYDRELDPLQAALRTSDAASQFRVGTPYTLPATTLEAVLSADTLATLRSVSGLVVAGRSYPLDVTLRIAGANSAEGTQTVRAVSTYNPTTGMGPVLLPATTWTPTGAGPLRFTLALPGSAPPYGSVLLALGTEREPATLDCAPAAVRIADPTIPWGSVGRYAFEPNFATPVFAGAVEEPKPPPPPDPLPAPPEPPAPSSTPAPAPRTVVVAKPPAGRIASTRLIVRGRRLGLTLSCPAGTSSCRGSIAVRRGRTALTRRASYVIAPGKQRTVRLSLSKAGRSALKRRRSLTAQVTLTTSAGVTATRRVTLAQRRGS